MLWRRHCEHQHTCSRPNVFKQKFESNNMLKNVLVFENIVKKSPSLWGSTFRPPLSMGSVSVPDLCDLTHSCCTATKRSSRPQKSLFVCSIFIFLSRGSDGGTIFWTNPHPLIGVIILISKILVDFSASSLCDCAPAFQLVYRRHWSHR